MRIIKIVSVAVLIAVGVGFLSLRDSSANERGNAANTFESKDANPNLSSVQLIDEGKMVASWYGPRFHGNLTANGEIYDQMALTAAHKSLPFGTLLRVTNLKNGKSALIRINDRGPYIDGRDLDLSKGTAAALGMIHRGVIRVKVEKLVLDESFSPAVTLN